MHGEIDETVVAGRIGLLANEFLGQDPENINVPSVQPGSDLARDDLAYPVAPTSHVVQGSLVTAREHLIATAMLWRSTPGGILLPQAYATILRTAVISASNAAWILNPTSSQNRVLNGLVIAAEDARNSRTVIQEHRDAQPKRPSASARSQQRADEELRECRQHHEDVLRAWWSHSGHDEPFDLRTAEKAARYNMSDVVKAASQAASHPDTFKAFGGLHLFRRMSADSHGLTWAKISRARRNGGYAQSLTRQGDVVELVDTLPVGDLFVYMANAQHIYKYAMSLYEKRAATPPEVA
jgi:hypothetical protein